MRTRRLKSWGLKLLATTLTACLVFSQSQVAMADDAPLKAATSALGRDPAAGKAEKFFVPRGPLDGWFVVNAYRENAVNARLKDCASTEAKLALSQSTPKDVVPASCPGVDPDPDDALAPEAAEMLIREPSTTTAEKLFIPKSADGKNGWWIMNHYRETQVNEALHLCQAKAQVTKECAPTPAPVVQGVELKTVLWSVLGAFTAGYAVSYVRDHQLLRPLPR